MFKKIAERCHQYALLMRLHRPIGIFLLLWPSLWGLWIASQGQASFKMLFIFISGVFLMRSAGCVINDFADKPFDGNVERTKMRPLATGLVSRVEAFILFAGLCLLALLLIIQLNSLTLLLAAAAVLLTFFYPFCKRYTHFPQVLLGIIFGGWGVLMAFAAVTQTVPNIAWFLFFIASFWPIIYDTFYAMVDREDDKKIGVKSMAILLGPYDRLVTGLLQILMLVLLVILGRILSLNVYYYLSLVCVAVLFAYQQYLIKNRNREQCFEAFLNNNWVGLVILFGLIVGSW